MAFDAAWQFGIGAGGATAAMLALWIVQRWLGNAGIVDVAWSAALGALALFFAATADAGAPGRRALLAGLACSWAFRLALHLLTDRVLGKPEDGRYVRMRQAAGANAEWWFLAFFLLQAGFVVLFAAPLLAAVRNPAPFPQWQDGLAILIWLAAVLGESIADAQLARFRGDPANRGTTCRAGLWRYSRHPNYFFEWLHWWTYVALAAGGGGWQWTALWCGPVAMYAFLRWFTGIPHTEAQALRTRADYAAYQRSTNMLFPWWPRPAAEAPR